MLLSIVANIVSVSKSLFARALVDFIAFVAVDLGLSKIELAAEGVRRGRSARHINLVLLHRVHAAHGIDSVHSGAVRIVSSSGRRVRRSNSGGLLLSTSSDQVLNRRLTPNKERSKKLAKLQIGQ